MQLERVRFIVEIVGISSLVVSLVFIGLELKQTRDMNIAQLHAERLGLFHQRMSATLESDAALSLHAKKFLLDWSEEGLPESGLTEIDKAVAEVTAHLLLAEFEVEYRFIEAGFDTRSIEGIRDEVKQTTERIPEIEAIWRHWWYIPTEDHGFNKFMEDALQDEEA